MAGPLAGLQGRARARRALPRSSRHLACCGALPRVRLDRERFLGFLRAALHRPLRSGVHPDHTLRHGLLRQGDLVAPGRRVLVVLRPARKVRPHRGECERSGRLPGLRWLWRRCKRKVRQPLRVLRPCRSRRARIEPAPSGGRSRPAREGASGRCSVRRRGAGRRDIRRPAPDTAVARDRTSHPCDADAGDDTVALAVLGHLPRLCGTEPNPRRGRRRFQASRGCLRFLARTHSDRLPDGTLLHLPARPGADDSLPRLRPSGMGLEPLRRSSDFEPRYGIVGAGFVWYSQVALIVVGHVIAVYLAHSISLRLLRDPERALRSQLPMLVLMVLYTMTSLWILAQPIVE